MFIEGACGYCFSNVFAPFYFGRREGLVLCVVFVDVGWCLGMWQTTRIYTYTQQRPTANI